MALNIWSLFIIAAMPIAQVLLIGLLGALLATGYFNILTADALRDMNKVVYVAFTPSLLFASLAKAVTIENIVSWWFMPVNIVLSSIVGGILGWVIVKIFKPASYLRGLVISCCCSANWGNILLVLVPAICEEDGTPFGNPTSCSTRGLSYASLSAALGSFVVWTYGYSLMKNAGAEYEKIRNQSSSLSGKGNTYSSQETDLSKSVDKNATDDEENQTMVPLLSSGTKHGKLRNVWQKTEGILQQIAHELSAPPNVGAIIGFVVGLIPWLKSLIIGSSAPLNVIQDSITLLGDGTIPALTLILGGNLTQGFHKSTLSKKVIGAMLIARYVILPVVGIGVVVGAAKVGFLPQDRLYLYVLLMQFVMPPAMNIGTLAQFFHVGQEECSVIFLWTYLAAAPMITLWSTIYLWILE